MAKRERYRNEEIWQQIREELIYVLQKNDIASKKELVNYFKKYHSHYNIGIEEIEVIIGESKYINELLKKNEMYNINFKKNLTDKFNEILVSEVASYNKDKEEYDEKVLFALYTLFETALTNEQLLNTLKNAQFSYDEILEQVKEIEEC